MLQLIKDNRYFFVPYLLFLLVSVFLLLIYSRPELHILTNKANSPFFDTFFKYATYLGDGIMVAVITLLLLFISYRHAIAFLTGSLVTSGIVQLFKQVIIKDAYRPSKYFEMNETYQLHIVEGVKLHSLHSFPSGHAATAFNVFFMLVLIVPNKMLKLLFFILAVTVAYSRVYLSQHFLIDITVGSFAGVFFLFLAYWWSLHWHKNWLDKSITNRFSAK